jgi:hypothetical protein
MNGSSEPFPLSIKDCYANVSSFERNLKLAKQPDQSTVRRALGVASEQRTQNSVVQCSKGDSESPKADGRFGLRRDEKETTCLPVLSGCW